MFSVYKVLKNNITTYHSLICPLDGHKQCPPLAAHLPGWIPGKARKNSGLQSCKDVTIVVAYASNLFPLMITWVICTAHHCSGHAWFCLVCRTVSNQKVPWESLPCSSVAKDLSAVPFSLHLDKHTVSVGTSTGCTWTAYCPRPSPFWSSGLVSASVFASRAQFQPSCQQTTSWSTAGDRSGCNIKSKPFGESTCEQNILGADCKWTQNSVQGLTYIFELLLRLQAWLVTVEHNHLELHQLMRFRIYHIGQAIQLQKNHQVLKHNSRSIPAGFSDFGVDAENFHWMLMDQSEQSQQFEFIYVPHTS